MYSLKESRLTKFLGNSSIKITIATVICGMLTSFAALATESNIFTASQCIDHALANSPILAVAETDVAVAEGLIIEAQAAQQPGLRLSAAARHYDQNRTGHMGAAPGAEQFYDTDLNEMQLQMRQLIWDSGRAQAKLNASRNIRDARTSQKLRIEQELLFSVLLACIDVVNQQAVIEAVIQNIEDVNAALTRIRKLQEVGKVANVDVLRVEVREQEVQSQKETAVHMLNSHLARLTRICGMSQTPTGIASDSIETIIQFPDIKPEDYLLTALAHRPDLLAQKAKVEATRNERKAAATGNQPVLNAVVAGNQYGNDGGKVVNNGFAGLELGWQFSDGGLTRSRKKIANANTTKENHLLRESELRVNEQVRIATSAIESAGARLVRSQKGLALAEEAYRIELLNYEHGKGTVNDLLDAQAALFTARSLLIRDQNDLVAARLAMTLALGEPIFRQNK